MPNALQRFLGASIKALTGLPFPDPVPTALADPRYGGANLATISFIPTDGSGHVRDISGDDDGSRAGDLWANSAVAICLDWIATNFPEADLQVGRRAGDDDHYEPVPDHPLIALLDDPNPVTTSDFYSLWYATLLSYLTDGNAYWLKERDGTGKVAGLRWLPHFAVEPWRANNREPLSSYLFSQVVEQKQQIYPIDPKDIVHFRYGVDPRNDLKGAAPLKRLLREVCSDNQVAEYTAAVLWNRGVLGLVVVPTTPDAIRTQEQADAIKAKFKGLLTGRNRGETVVMSGPVKVEQPNFSPDQLALTEISRIPEARICAAMGVHPGAVGLNVGDAQRSYANTDAFDRFSWRKLIARQNRMAEALYRQLLTEFEPDTGPFRIGWDTSRVEALQADSDAESERAGKLYQGYQLVTRAEARAMVGKDAAEDGSDDVYYTEWVAGIAARYGTPVNAAGVPSLGKVGKGGATVPGGLPGATTNGSAKGLPGAIRERLALMDGAEGDDRLPFSARAVTAVADPDAGVGNPHGLPSGAPILNLMDRTFRAQHQALHRWAASLPAEPSGPLFPPALDHWTDSLATGLESRLRRYAVEAARATASSLGADPRSIPASDPTLATLAATRAQQASGLINRTTLDQLQVALSRIEGPPTRGAILGAIDRVLDHALDVRAEVIGTFEASGIVHEAALDVARRSGEPIGKRWSVDGRPCQICVDNAAAGVIPLDGPFPSGHDSPPCHQNCMCSNSFESL